MFSRTHRFYHFKVQASLCDITDSMFTFGNGRIGFHNSILTRKNDFATCKLVFGPCAMLLFSPYLARQKLSVSENPGQKTSGLSSV